MDEIYNIIDYYSKRGLLLDKKAIESIIDILLINNDINTDYDIKVYNLYYLLNKKNVIASFDYESIRVYMSRFKKYFLNKKINFILEDELNYYETILYKNICFLKVIIHEMEHLLQYENRINNYSTIERDLMCAEKDFILSIDEINKSKNIPPMFKRMLINQYKKLYETNYQISFIERITEINALEKTGKIIRNYYPENDKLIILNEIQILNTKMKSYKDMNDNPTKRFFRNIGSVERVLKIDPEELSNDERLRYGFNLEQHEYLNNKNILRLTKKRE